MPHIRLISFGYLHQPTGPDGDPVPPAADRVEDVRERLHDPAVARDILDLDGRDVRVQKVVLNTPGARELIVNLADYAASPAAPRTIAIGCAGGKHRAAALVELLALLLGDRGHTEVEVEHRHVHLPRVLKSPESEPDKVDLVDTLFELYDRLTAVEQDPGDGMPSGPQSAANFAEMAQRAFAARFAPHAALTAPDLPWTGYRITNPHRGPHAVAHLGPGWFHGQQLYLTYQRTYDCDVPAWHDTFELVDSVHTAPREVETLADLVDELYGMRASYNAWCQEGTDTAGPFDDDDPYEYADPRDDD